MDVTPLISKVSILMVISLLVPFISIDIDAQGSSEGEDIGLIDFEYQRLYKETNLIYRAAFGDLIPGNGFTEMATCSRNGRITVTYGSDMSWNTELIKHVYVNNVSTDPAEVTSLAVGDILEEREGDELISVDTDNSVRLHTFDNGKWNSKVIWEDTNWLYEVAIAEIDMENDGPEIVVVGEDHNATLLTRTGNVWKAETLFKDNFPLDACAVDDLLPDTPGKEIIVSGIDRNVTLITGSPGNWTSRDIAFLGFSVIDLVILDLDPNIIGKEIYASNFNGDVYQIYPDKDHFSKKKVHFEGKMIYGLESGEIEGEPVISMASYNNRIALLYYDEGFKVKELYREDYIMVGTGIFDLDPYHKGNEVFALSGLGYLTMIYHDDPGLDILLPFNSTKISVNESIEIPFIIRSKGGYDGTVSFTPTVIGTSIVIPQPPVINEPGMFSCNFPGFNEPGDYMFGFAVNGPNGPILKSIDVKVTEDNRKVNFSVGILNGSVGRDRQRTFNFKVISETDIGLPFTFQPFRIPSGISIDTNRSAVDPLGSPIPVSSTVKVRPGAELKNHEFFLIGSSTDNRNRAIGFSIDVQMSSIADFDIFIDSSGIILGEGEEATIKIAFISINGYSEDINLSLIEEVEGLDVTFSKTSVVPPGEVDLTVKVLDDEGPFFIFVRGTSGGLTRDDSLRVDTRPPMIKLNIESPNSTLQLEKNEKGSLTGVIELNLTPENGIIESVSIEIEGLEEYYTVNLDPVNIQRIPYPMKLEITVNSPLNGTLGSINLNITGEGGSWTYQIYLSYPETEKNNDTGLDPAWIIISALTILFIFSIGLLLFIRGSNPLNHNEGVSEDHGAHEGHGGSGETAERYHGRGRGLDRLVGGKR